MDIDMDIDIDIGMDIGMDIDMDIDIPASPSIASPPKPRPRNSELFELLELEWDTSDSFVPTSPPTSTLEGGTLDPSACPSSSGSSSSSSSSLLTPFVVFA